MYQLFDAILKIVVAGGSSDAAVAAITAIRDLFTK